MYESQIFSHQGSFTFSVKGPNHESVNTSSMRLLQLLDNGDLSLVERYGKDIPPYTILSHTWGSKDDEVTFKELSEGKGKRKSGYEKLAFCGKQTAKDGLEFFWVDTCCIDKSSSAELTEAINSMFQWYRKAEKCYVYLSDVKFHNGVAFEDSRWFSRGWTLQELLAPECVEFFSAEGYMLGDKFSRAQEIAKITSIPAEALRGRALSQFSIDERMEWATKRETTREEDMAYSMLGIFDISMSLIYGEGKEKAFKRLRKEIEEGTEATETKSTRYHYKHLNPPSANGQLVEMFSNQPQNTGKQELVSQVSRVQAGDLYGLLVSVQSHITQLSNHSNQLDDPRPQSTSISKDIGRIHDDSGLLETIDRLHTAVPQDGHVRGEEADPVINDLERIVSSVSLSPDNCTPTLSKRKSEALNETEDISPRKLKRLYGIVASVAILYGIAPTKSLLGYRAALVLSQYIGFIPILRAVFLPRFGMGGSVVTPYLCGAF